MAIKYEKFIIATRFCNTTTAINSSFIQPPKDIYVINKYNEENAWEFFNIHIYSAPAYKSFFNISLLLLLLLAHNEYFTKRLNSKWKIYSHNKVRFHLSGRSSSNRKLFKFETHCQCVVFFFFFFFHEWKWLHQTFNNKEIWLLT